MVENNHRKLVETEIDLILSSGLFGRDFKFRNGQREAISDICTTFLNGEIDTIIIDAPTGSGKSVISLFSSTVLSHFKKSGYILTSELMLQDQYERDLKKLQISAAMVKGVDNYECIINHQPFSLGICSSRGISPKRMDCVKECPYILKRNAAANSSIAVLGYAYWLIQRNYVAPKNPESQFKKRDFVFFDECHNINKIVQSHLAPRISKKLFEILESVQRFLMKHDIIDYKIMNETITRKLIFRLSEELTRPEIESILIELENVLGSYIAKHQKLKDRAKVKFPADNAYTSVNVLPQSWEKNIKHLDLLKDIHCKIQDYNKLVKQDGRKNIVKKVNDENIVLNFINESFLVKKHLINESRFKVYMSATIGDPLEYMRTTGIDNAKYLKIENSFNFQKSPILFLKGINLNFRNKYEQVPKLIETTDKILDNFEQNTKGIIHTSSYEISDMIYDSLKNAHRLITYRGSTEKKSAIAEFLESNDKILIGPSLLEGLDLHGDASRFQIFFKVPYSSLGDPLIKAKLNASQSWYNYDVSIKVLQGIGRSIRSEDDWARTYLLDGNFIRLLKSQKLPTHITSRYGSLNKLLDEI